MELGRRWRLSAHGTTFLVGGLVVQAVTTYVFLILSGRELGASGFGALSGLYVLVTSLATGLFQPVEQEVSRRRGRERAFREWDDTLYRRALAQGLVASVGAVVVALLLWPVSLRVLGEQRSLLIGLLVALPGYACWFTARGEFAGQRRLVRYGVLLAVDGGVRMGGAVLLLLTGWAGVGSLGALIAAAPWIAFLVTTIGWHHSSDDAVPRRTPSLTRPLYLLIASALAAQLLINAGSLVVTLLAGPQDRASAGAFLAVLVVLRTPVFLFTAVQPRLLPALAEHAAAGRREPFVQLLRVVTLGLVALATLTAVGAVALGPPLTRIVFGFGDELGRTTYLLLTIAIGLFLVATVVAQALISTGHHAFVTGGWLLGLVGLAAGTAVGHTPVVRATNGLLAGALVATAALGLALVLTLRAWQVHTGLSVDTEDHAPGR